MNLADKIDFWKKLDQECHEVRKSLSSITTKASIVLREIVEEQQGLTAQCVLVLPDGRRYRYAGLETFIEVGGKPWAWGRKILKDGSTSEHKSRLYTHWSVEK